MGAPNRLALQLDAEISAVITAMRQNAKWAVVPGKYNVSSSCHQPPGQPTAWIGVNRSKADKTYKHAALPA